MSRAAMIVFGVIFPEEARSLKGTCFHLDISLLQTGRRDVAQSSRLYGGSNMRLHVILHINNRTCSSLGNANT